MKRQRDTQRSAAQPITAGSPIAQSRNAAAGLLCQAVDAMMDAPSGEVAFTHCEKQMVWTTLVRILSGTTIRLGDLAVAVQHIADTLAR